jgi:adenine-specific DNA-methyltransferase
MPRREGIARARTLRASQTSPERLLWSKLRDRRLAGWKWRRQFPFPPYIAAFCCIEAALVVELDGGQHSERTAYDERRTAHLEQQGVRVIRFWNHQVLEDLDWVCGEIYAACGGAAPHPTLSPEGRGF